MVGQSLVNASALPDARSRVKSERRRGVLRASGKAVRTWPSVVAVDAGPMQIQLWEGAALGRGETVLQGTTRDTVHAENWLRRKSIAKTVVEEGGRRDRFDGEAERCGVPGSTQSFRVGESSLMPQS